ncbi:transposase [Streptomyces sp. HMX87]|uniref:transposase n=1 Tax=Streptomyces sp. HMX87 TaxID=3390849 RepID=UPI003A865D85
MCAPAPQAHPGPARRPRRPRCRPDQVIADKAYSSRGFRAYLPKHGVTHTIPEKTDQRRSQPGRGHRGGRPPTCVRDAYRQRNTVERCFNCLKGFRGVATRYEKTAVLYGVTQAALLTVAHPTGGTFRPAPRHPLDDVLHHDTW